MADGDTAKDQATTASMADLTTMETSMRSSMDAQFAEIRDQFAEMRDLIKQLASGKAPPVDIPLEDSANSNDGKTEEDKEKDKGVEENKSSKPSTSSSLPEGGKPGYHAVSHVYTPDPLIPHPRINPIGPPPKLNALAFTSWQHSMRSHVNSASIELWRIIQVGFKAMDPSNLTSREVVDAQLNATALHMLELAVGEKDIHHIQQLTTAKEAWDCLSETFLGNESMKRNRYDALNNEAEGFYMLESETHEEMYGRLKNLAQAFYNVGAKYADDAWVKRKYVNALMPFEPVDLKAIQGRHNYLGMTSNEVMQEMQASKVATKNALDSRARAMGVKQGPSLALKAKVVSLDDSVEIELSPSNMHPDELERALNDHVALATRTFWRDPAKAKAINEQKNNPSGSKEFAMKTKTCYNCHNKHHFIKDCPYENREHHGGRLVPKGESTTAQRKPFVKKKPFFKKAPRIVLMTQEEYPSDDSEEEEEPTREVAALAIVSTSSPSLFESPNENLTINNARCLMAHATEVSSSTPKTMHEMNDNLSLVIKKELVAFDTYIANLQGEGKKYVESLMSQLGAAEELLETKSEIEREDSLTIASLKASLEEESEYRTTLEERLESLDDKNDEIIAKIIKDRDHAFAKYKVIKKEKAEFVVANARLLEDIEKLDKAHKALESTHSLLVKAHEQLQTQLSKSNSSSTSTPLCDHANVIEENARLKVELAKATSAKTSIPKGKEKVVAQVVEQKQHKGKEGLGYVAKAKKKKSNDKAKPAQAKTSIAGGDATRGKTTRSDFAGHNNPNYILYVDYYGDVYAKYVGPYDGFIAYSIWVPKTLVANQRGPIARWVPKTKQ